MRRAVGEAGEKWVLRIVAEAMEPPGAAATMQ
jgi:hypothetical protein